MNCRSKFLCIAFCLTAGPATGQTWTSSLLGNAFVSYMRHNTHRGAEEVDAIAWVMGELARTSSHGAVAFRTMLSFDAITLGECGYPRVMANAGLCNDAPFEDRSHTHPFFMDLSGALTRRSGTTTWSLRAGLAGEPAIGPTSYMHRASAQLDPVIPLTHHEFNPAHAAHGFATAGLERGRARLEISAFNGSSADEDNAYDFDLAPLHAWSGRLSWKLSGMTSAQVSAAIMDPHGAHAGHGDTNDKLHVYIASIETMHTRGSFTVDATLGVSRQTMTDMNDGALLAEVLLRRGAHALMLRAEMLERTELVGEHVGEEHIVTPFDTRQAELAAGYAVRLTEALGMSASIGARAAITFLPDFWQGYYDASRARSFALFVHAQPRRAHRH